MLIFSTGIVNACGGSGNSIIVLSAVSMADVINEISYEFENLTNTEVFISYAGSQYLAQQIVNGSPGDVILSAGESPIRFLSEKELIEPNTVNLLSNSLVVIARPNSLQGTISVPMDLENPEIKYISIADPRLSPAGIYAKESLVNLNLWDSINDRILRTPDVRAAMLAVTTGAAQVGIVYATDAMTLSDIDIYDIIPHDSYTEIKYVLAITTSSPNKLLALNFITFLQSEEAIKIYNKHGFEFHK